ncbi:hypothetical protein Nepgr_004196 [Nepenthes gracilis]|uniref:Uncharacterized protein n=1 Tax=Nepenthes gracilis TaxID=150966 RepID=A0AAD3S0W7_NEPGR|nr:hypothetical protein Nepgr_004196 [Nepenthes gracilis]
MILLWPTPSIFKYEPTNVRENVKPPVPLKPSPKSSAMIPAGCHPSRHRFSYPRFPMTKNSILVHCGLKFRRKNKQTEETDQPEEKGKKYPPKIGFIEPLTRQGNLVNDDPQSGTCNELNKAFCYHVKHSGICFPGKLKLNQP